MPQDSGHISRVAKREIIQIRVKWPPATLRGVGASACRVQMRVKEPPEGFRGVSGSACGVRMRFEYFSAWIGGSDAEPFVPRNKEEQSRNGAQSIEDKARPRN